MGPSVRMQEQLPNTKSTASAGRGSIRRCHAGIAPQPPKRFSNDRNYPSMSFSHTPAHRLKGAAPGKGSQRDSTPKCAC